MKILFLELKTSGFNEAHDFIYQIAGIIYEDGKIQEDFNFYIEPEDSCDKELFESYKIDGRIVTHKWAKETFIPYLEEKAQDGKFHLTGYHTNFHKRFLRPFFGVTGTKMSDIFYSDMLDVMVLASYVLKGFRHNLKNFKKSNVCNLFGIKVDEYDAKSLVLADYHLYCTLEKYIILKPFKNE